MIFGGVVGRYISKISKKYPFLGKIHLPTSKNFEIHLPKCRGSLFPISLIQSFKVYRIHSTSASVLGLTILFEKDTKPNYRIQAYFYQLTMIKTRCKKITPPEANFFLEKFKRKYFSMSNFMKNCLKIF